MQLLDFLVYPAILAFIIGIAVYTISDRNFKK